MMRGLLTVLSFVSTILFPWPLSVLLVIISSLYVPLVPFAVGIFADTLYYTPQESFLPFFTMIGAIVSGIAVFVRSRLSASII